MSLQKLEKELKGRYGDFEFGSKSFEGVPNHVAFICDGNRRYAKEHGLPTSEGHELGAENAIKLAERSMELGIRNVTFWVMDTKNLKKRSKDEIKNIIRLAIDFLRKLRNEYLDGSDIRFNHIGKREYLPSKLVELIDEIEKETAHHKTANLNMAFNYGGRDEIVRVIKKLIRAGYDESDITENLVSENLDTVDFGDPDIIVRTGKEKRLSGFMPWQSAPSELFFPKYFFPEYSADLFEADVRSFLGRERRLGA